MAKDISKLSLTERAEVCVETRGAITKSSFVPKDKSCHVIVELIPRTLVDYSRFKLNLGRHFTLQAIEIEHHTGKIIIELNVPNI